MTPTRRTPSRLHDAIIILIVLIILTTIFLIFQDQVRILEAL